MIKESNSKDDHIPILLTFLFGGTAGAALQGASPRLLLWCRAFEDWLLERKLVLKPITVRYYVLAWRRLSQHVGKIPWELTPTDLQQYVAWMQEKGFKPSTINNELGIFSRFFRWCSQKRVDSQCLQDFDPTENVKRLRIRDFQGAKPLSRGEVARLLQAMQSDPSILGKRDYAFVLARLNFGVRFSSLQKLLWVQILVDQEGAWLRWKPEAAPQSLPEQVWKAMRNALEAGGRLASIKPGDYIFAPLREPYKEDTGMNAEDWRADKPLSFRQINYNIKIYAETAGIEKGRLCHAVLRLTALRLRLDRGASPEDMRLFMDLREPASIIRQRLKSLPQLPLDDAPVGKKGENRGRLPCRQVKPLKPGDGLIHGFYANFQPPGAVAEIIREDVQGIGNEIENLRLLARKLLDRLEQAMNSQEAASLVEAHSLAASRIGEMIKAERELANRGKENHWAEDFLERLDRISIDLAGQPVSDQARKDAFGGDLQMETAARRLVEEIASVRCTLRSSFRLAMETQDTKELVRFAEIYGICCIRLIRLLKIEKNSHGQLEAYLKEGVQKALEIAAKELGLAI